MFHLWLNGRKTYLGNLCFKGHHQVKYVHRMGEIVENHLSEKGLIQNPRRTFCALLCLVLISKVFSSFIHVTA
jgi:hypothetical protein